MDAKSARVNMIDFLSEEALDEVQNRYAKIREKTYPGLEFTVWVRSEPQSMMTSLIYESEGASFGDHRKSSTAYCEHF